MITLPEAAEAWSRTHHAQAEGRAIRYREAGSGPPVVLAHGLGLSADFWVRNGPPLAAAGFRVLAPDLPGFGRTGGPAGLSVEEQAGWLAAWAGAAGVGPAAFVGHSISCQAVLELAATRPERVTALVLAAPTGDPKPGRLLRQAAGFLADPVLEPPDVFVRVGEAYARAGPHRWLRTWWLAGRHDALATARRVRAPGIVIVGRRDPVVREAFARDLAEALTGGRFVRLARGAHAVVYDAADDFNRETIGFLREVLSEGIA